MLVVLIAVLPLHLFVPQLPIPLHAHLPHLDCTRHSQPPYQTISHSTTLEQSSVCSHPLHLLHHGLILPSLLSLLQSHHSLFTLHCVILVVSLFSLHLHASLHCVLLLCDPSCLTVALGSIMRISSSSVLLLLGDCDLLTPEPTR